MSQSKSYLPPIYNPSNQPKEAIAANFVIRTSEFAELMEGIRKDTMEHMPQHYIVQGQRGYGKTTLLLRIKYEILGDNNLNSWLIPVQFDEEEYSVRTLEKFWEKVIEILEHDNKVFHGLSEQVKNLPDAEYSETVIYNILSEALIGKKKKLILLIDNFGEIMQKFTLKEQQRLREILTTSNLFRIIGASAVALEFTQSYDKPFFDYFKTITLGELNKTGTIKLLEKLSEDDKYETVRTIIKEQPERIEALRLLTGGVPRTIVLLFNIFIDNDNGDSFKDLEKVLDLVTPLYKARLDSLSAIQQAIIDAMALNWDAISTKDIAKAVRMESKAVSSQLNELVKNQVITKVTTSKKNHLYQIGERFFNIYYLMRIGNRNSEKKVRWLVKFFEVWYGPKELESRARAHILALKEKHPHVNHAFYITQALAQTNLPLKLQHDLLQEGKQYLSSCNSSLSCEVIKSHVEMREEITDLIKNKDFIQALAKLKAEKIIDKDAYYFIANVLNTSGDFKMAEKYYLMAVEKEHVSAMYNLALLYQLEFKDFQKAEKYYLMAVEKKHASAMYNLALLYEKKFKDFQKAEKFYLLAVEKKHASAMYNLALLYQLEFKDFQKAEKFYLLAVEKEHVGAMYNLALLYELEFKDFQKAEKFYLLAVEKKHANAVYNLALLYEKEFKDFQRAEKFYLMAVEKGAAYAMNNLALLYQLEFKDFQKAEKYYLMAVEKEHASAMYNLALLYQLEFKDFQKAGKFYLMAVEKGHASAMYNLALLYEKEFKDFQKAEKFYLMAVEKEHTRAMYNLALLYEREFKDFQKAEKFYLMAVEKETAYAMNNLALLYQLEFKDFQKAEKYYLMAVEKEHASAMYNLALLYEQKFNDFQKAEKFYLMAVEKEHASAMYNLALLYEQEFKDFQKAEKFYLMAVEKEHVGAMYNLALLYEQKFNDFQKAEKFYLMAVEKEDVDSVNALLWIYFQKNIKKLESVILQKKFNDKIDDFYFAHTTAMICLWNNDIESALQLFYKFINIEDSYKDITDDIALMFNMFLAKKQYNFMFKLFQENQFDLKDKYKPIYYATLSLLGKEYEDEYKKMPPELKETVEDILKKIEQMSIDYA